MTGTDLFSGEPVGPDAPLRLGPWDITVLVEA